MATAALVQPCIDHDAYIISTLYIIYERKPRTVRTDTRFDVTSTRQMKEYSRMLVTFARLTINSACPGKKLLPGPSPEHAHSIFCWLVKFILLIFCLS